jgi:diguanylate cyclase (GGDEF)-like protein
LQRLGAEIRFAERHAQPLALLMLDIDHFKQINDSHGHMIGDDVLRAIVGVLADTLRAEDVLARYGGEEFSVLVRGVSKENARMLGERLRREVEEMALTKETGEALPLTISVGISMFPLENAADVPPERVGEKLIELADAALYRAKNAGRNRVEF